MSNEGEAVGAAAPAEPEAEASRAEDAARAARHSEAGIFAILSQFAGMQIVMAGTGLVRNKVVAFRLGPTAFGEIAQVMAVMAVVGTLVSFGMGVSLNRNVARAQTRDERQRQLSNANGVVLCLAAVAVTVTLGLLFTGRFLPLAGLPQDPALFLTVLIFVAGVPLGALASNYLALLQGVLDVRGVALQRSLAVLLATVVSIPLVWFLGLVGAAIQYFALSAFAACLLGWRCRNLGFRPLRFRLDRSVVAFLATFGVMSLSSGFAQGVADTAVRTRLIEAAGATANGLLQASVVLATTIQSVVLASIGSVSLATIAAQSDRDEVSRSVDRLLNVVLPVGAAALGLLGLMGVVAMRVLYSGAFTGGARYFPYVLTANLLLVFVWVVGAPLLAYGDRVLWLVLDLVYALGRWGIAVALMPRLEGVAVTVGMAGAVAIHLALTLAVFRFRYRLALAPRHLARLAAGVALVVALSVAGASATLPALAGGLAVWGIYVALYARQTGVVELVWSRLRPGQGA
jgi:O-antigen/teichoic acid export membrane protein